MMTELEEEYFEIGWELVNLEDRYSHEIFNSKFGKEFHSIMMKMIEANNKFSVQEKTYEKWCDETEEAMKADLTPVAKGR